MVTISRRRDLPCRFKRLDETLFFVDGKHGRKMTESPSAQAAASTSNTKKQLQEFYRNFKVGRNLDAFLR